VSAVEDNNKGGDLLIEADIRLKIDVNTGCWLHVLQLFFFQIRKGILREERMKISWMLID
jgi:hypothetical protein